MDSKDTVNYFELTDFGSSSLFPESQLVKNNPFLMNILDSLPHCVLILNKKKQIIAANKAAFHTLNKDNIEDILGQRIGTSFSCIRKDEFPAGCGSTKFCKQCGSIKAQENTLKQKTQSVEEMRIISEENGKMRALNFRVHTDIITLEGHELLLMSIQDISTQKRAEILEKMFFHDILNTSGALQGLATLLPHANTESDREEIVSAILDSTVQLIEEIKSQRDLVWAEKGNLEVKTSEIYINQILKGVHELYAKGDLAKNKIFSVGYLTEDVKIKTDSTLLIRSLGNLVKNALEASVRGNEIKIYVETNQDNVKFHVYNEKVIEESIMVQIFQKSFSTKNGLGRGIGTYSVKLLVEQYLKGRVYLESNPKNRTIFTIQLPI
jgi:signal transduction histidine kinase